MRTTNSNQSLNLNLVRTETCTFIFDDSRIQNALANLGVHTKCLVLSASISRHSNYLFFFMNINFDNGDLYKFGTWLYLHSLHLTNT